MKAIASFVIPLLMLSAPAWSKQISGAISAQADTIHLELTGEQNWNYDVKRSEKKNQTLVEMTIDPLDEATIKNLTSFKSDMVSSISVDKKGVDGKYVVNFVLAGDEVENFDYLTDQPSRLIMDFYISNNRREKTQAKKSDKKSDTEEQSDLAQSDKKTRKSKTLAKSSSKQRNPATADALVISNRGVNVAENEGSDKQTRSGIFDGGDPNYERFTVKDYEIKEESIIRSKENYYIPFPMLQTQSEAWEKIKTAPAVYQIVPKDNDENKQARLLLTLFEKQRYAVFLKTVQWFKEKYPDSQYNEMIDYMQADTHLLMWKDKKRSTDYDQAMLEYRNAIQKYPKSALAERTSLKLGYIALEKGDALGSLRLFKEHIDSPIFDKDKKESFSKDLARMGTGLALAKLNRFDDAVNEYTNLEKSTPFRELKMEAAFRRGDSFVQSKRYLEAVEDYRNSLKKYPESQSLFPNAYYNQAESLFGLDKFRESLDVYREFVKKFPSNEQAPFAMTRLGELLEILGADKSRVMGAYLETYFRYGESNSAIIARLRLLSGRMKGMKPKEVSNAVGEIMSLAKKLDLPNIEQFANIMVADGYTRRGEFQKSIDLFTKYYQQNPTTVDTKLINRRIVGNIAEKIRSEVDQGNFIQALKTHRQFADNWLKTSGRLDTKYDLGRAFEMAGVSKEAETYYKDVLNRIYALKGTKTGKEVEVTENIPSEDEMNLRLAATMAQEQKYGPSYDYLKNIKNPERMSETQQIERVNLAVKLLEKRGDTDSAVRYLTELLKTWKGQPALVAEPYLKLAELEVRQGKKEDAIQSLNKVDELMKDSGQVSEDVHLKSLQALADLYAANKQTDKLIGTYKNLLEKYEEKKPLASLRYKLGEIYFQRGDVKKAAEIWNDFKSDKGDFWKNLAQEQLKNSEWRDGYKKYIKRIPAMSESK